MLQMFIYNIPGFNLCGWKFVDWQNKREESVADWF